MKLNDQRYPKEAPFQRDAMRYLRLVLTPPAFAFHIPNESKRSVVAGAELKRQGLIPGAPDIVIYYEGKAISFELKAAKNYLSQNQKNFQAMSEAAGVPYIMVKTINEIRDALIAHGVPIREKVGV